LLDSLLQEVYAEKYLKSDLTGFTETLHI